MARGIFTDSQKKFDVDYATVEAVRARILQAMGEISRSDLSRLTGESTANISRYLSGKMTPSMKFLAAVCLGLELNSQWVLFGKGPMKAGKIDWENVTFEDLSAEYQRRILSVIDFIPQMQAMQKQLESMRLLPRKDRGKK